MEQSNQHTNYPASSPDPQRSESITIPVIEERVSVSKETVETGRVRLTKQVSAEQVTVEVPLMQEHTEVERVPINAYVETAPQVRYEGDTMIIPVLREEVVVTKRLLLVEELHVTKQQVTTVSTQPVTLRQETVTVERIPSDLSGSHSPE